MIDLYPSALPRPPEGTAPTELGPLADALWTGLAGITQALLPCSPWLLANPPANMVALQQSDPEPLPSTSRAPASSPAAALSCASMMRETAPTHPPNKQQLHQNIQKNTHLQHALQSLDPLPPREAAPVTPFKIDAETDDSSPLPAAASAPFNLQLHRRQPATFQAHPGHPHKPTRATTSQALPGHPHKPFGLSLSEVHPGHPPQAI